MSETPARYPSPTWWVEAGVRGAGVQGQRGGHLGQLSTRGGAACDGVCAGRAKVTRVRAGVVEWRPAGIRGDLQAVAASSPSLGLPKRVIHAMHTTCQPDTPLL